MRVAHVVPDTDAEGPGRRYAIWTRGCSLRCPGCCNPELFKHAGAQTPVAQILADIAATDGIEGVSLLGGEPTEQPDLVELCAGIQVLGRTVMLYSGHRLAELNPALLEHVDLLVDGLYDPAMPDSTRRWIGSTNQQLHLLTDAYQRSDPRFWTDETVEIRFAKGQITVNGWPAAAKAAWR